MANTGEKYYLGNKNLPTSNMEFEWTPKMVRDLKKSQQNIIYFAENFFYIVNLDQGKIKIPLYKSQKRVLRKFRDNRFVACLASRQTGKALALDTPIPSPNGWTTMGSLKDSDVIFDNYGNETTVKKAWDIMYNRPCYEIEFDNGEKIISDEEHLWFTQSANERDKGISGSKKTTKDIYYTLFKKGSNEPNHRIPISMKGVEYKSKTLPIDPYILGLWLGDGSSTSSTITVGDRDKDDMLRILKENTQFDDISIKTYQKGSNSLRISVLREKKSKSLNTLLRKNNLYNNKHIPIDYMIGSRDQRLELLRGLIDSDGYIEKNTGIAYFYNTNLNLATQVKKLIESLGYKATYRDTDVSFKGKSLGKSATITFKPREHICKISFKRDRIKCESQTNNSKLRGHWHYIKNIKHVDSVPVRCITVDSEDGMFLCGNTYIPTSNTTMMTIGALWIACFQNDQRILIVANKEQTAINIFSRIRTAYEMLPNYLKPGVVEYGKTYIKLENGSSIGISTTSSDAGRGDSCNVLILDELAFIPNNLIKEFWNSVYPIISSSKKSKIFVASTPNGKDNLFYKLYTDGENKKSNWVTDKIMWYEIPGRDEKWKEETIRSIGSEEAFAQEFDCITGDTSVSISDNGDIKLYSIKELVEKLDTEDSDKFYRSKNISNTKKYKVETKEGFKDFSGIMYYFKRYTYEIKLETTSLKCTEGHRIYTIDGFKEIKDIEHGDFIILKNNKVETVINIVDNGYEDVYDILDVADTHSYYTNNILSHNCEFLDNGDSLLDEEHYRKLEKQLQDPKNIFEDGHYKIWEEPNKESIYTIGVDVAEGVGKNKSVINIFDITDLTDIRQVAKYSSNKIVPFDFTPKVNEICQHWGSPPVLIERNNCGATVVDLLHNTFRYPNIVSYSPKTGKQKYDRLGVYAHTNTKYKGVVNMRYWVHTLKAVTFRCKETLEELRTFERKPNGTWAAKDGYEDDDVMSLIWSLMILDTELVNKYYDVIEFDDNGKPKVLQLSEFVSQNFRGFLSEYKTLDENDPWEPPSPMFDSINTLSHQHSELEDLLAQGWEIL